MREVEDCDAKLTLFELLEATKQGETVVIMHHGQPVAHLCPAPIPSPSLESQRSYSGEKEKASSESATTGRGSRGRPSPTACGTSWMAAYGRR